MSRPRTPSGCLGFRRDLLFLNDTLTMTQPLLDLSSLQKAHGSLAAVMAFVPADDTQKVLKRDAAIQRFEYTYELASKMLKRFLEATSSSPATIDQLDFRDLLRLGGEAGLIRSVEDWFVFRDKRNITSHAYDEAKAEEVFAVIPAFLKASEELLAALVDRVQKPL